MALLNADPARYNAINLFAEPGDAEPMGPGMGDDSQILQLQGLLDRHSKGDARARDELMALAFDPLVRLTRAMLRKYPGVHRWEGTDDVMQGASMRLYRSLSEVTPPTPADFYRLASAQIRRELIDLARRFAGPHGIGANYDSYDPARGPESTPSEHDESQDPAQLAEWSAFHQQAGALPDQLRSVFDLIYYQGLSQEDAAEALGVSVRTVKRHWQKARLALHDALGGRLPGV
jgi:RNA polymerase sigma factor (sigma-70 family)